MQTNPDNLTIGAFARAAEVNVETIRFYQRKGLLPQPVRPPGSIRRYGKADVARVKFIKAAQRLGFSLDEVTQLLQLEDGTRCKQAGMLAGQKLRIVREKLSDLKRMEAVLAGLVHACHTHKGNISCPLIDALRE